MTLEKSDVINAINILGKALTIFLIACALAVYVVLLYVGKSLYESRNEYVQQLVTNNPVFFEKTFTEIFPQAIACKKSGEKNECVTKMRREMERLLPTPIVDQLVEKYKIPDQPHTMWVDQPMYFITLKDGQIIKLFFSGGVKLENINTIGELKVMALLNGWTDKLYDIVLNDRTIPMTYLDDLYSEAEVIAPYKINGKTVGAIVYLHGD